MDICSMTGFARAEGPVGGARLSVELKSVNHRYLDYRLHLPRELYGFEAKLTEMIRAAFARGRIEAWLDFSPGEKPVAVRWNEPLARGVVEALKEMQSALGLVGVPDLALLAAQKDVIVAGDPAGFGDQAEAELTELFGRALSGLRSMRAREGATLAADIRARLGQVEEWMARLAERKEIVVAGIRERLDRRLRELLGPESRLDPERLAAEVAILADRADITEELVRFKSHQDQFRAVLSGEGPRGRKLDFLLQELFREINTASNKSQDAAVSALAVDVKTELEKIREQVQNLE